MEELFSSENGKVAHLSNDGIIIMRFIGDMSDEAYFEIWDNSIECAIKTESKLFLIDQSQIGNVSFMARSKVVIKYLPTIKKEIGRKLKVAVLTSGSVVHKSGMKYLAKTFQKLASFNIEFFNDEKGAIYWIGEK